MRGWTHTIRSRRAFSLAEVMIAIGILGVGLLMVAATFPVGLDQSRIVAEETMGKVMIPNEALRRLELLVKEQATFKRIPLDAQNPDPTDPTKWPFSVAQSMRLVAPTPAAIGTFYGPLRAHLANGDALQDPFLATATVPYLWTGLNELLVAPYIPPASVGQAPQCAGAGTRFYPSVAARCNTSPLGWKWSLPLRTDAQGQPSFVEPPYTWSALYQIRTVVTSITPLVKTDQVRFVIFVNRRGQDWPGDWPKMVNFGQVDFLNAADPAAAQGKLMGNEIWFPPSYNWPAPTATTKQIYNLRQMPSMSNSRLSAMLSDRDFLVQADGTACQVKRIEKAKNLNNSDPSSNDPDDFHRITLSIAPTTTFFWFVPADEGAGRSPCIWLSVGLKWIDLP